jgi:hypothetical protein
VTLIEEENISSIYSLSQFTELFQNKATDALIDFIVNNPEARERVEGFVDSRLIEEYNLLKRLKDTEKKLGLNNWSNFED